MYMLMSHVGQCTVCLGVLSENSVSKLHTLDILDFRLFCSDVLEVSDCSLFANVCRIGADDNFRTFFQLRLARVCTRIDRRYVVLCPNWFN
jgi:hypothetical protein